MDFLIWKTLHIVSVVLFLGNITTGLLWAELAHRSRDFGLIAATFRGITRSDCWFTVPGVIGIIASGMAAAIDAHLPILRTGWIVWAIVLLLASGAVFSVRLAPLQRRIAALAASARTDAATWAEYDATYRSWKLWGALALSTPFGALVLMVLKPTLPAF